MKKIALVALVIMLGLSTAAFAAGNGLAIGAEFALTNLSGYGAMLTFHLPSVPVMFGLGASLGSGYVDVALNGDWWLAHGKLVSAVDYYIGLGFTGAVAVSGGGASFDLGARLPLGLQIWPLGKTLELFLELAPAWIPITAGGIYAANFAVQSGLGFRIWF
jgi:hypothetical protein